MPVGESEGWHLQGSKGANSNGKNTNVKDFWNEMHGAGLYAGNEDSWNRNQVDAALAIHSKYALKDGGAWNNLQLIQARDNTLRSEEIFEEYLAMMTQSMAQSAAYAKQQAQAATDSVKAYNKQIEATNKQTEAINKQAEEASKQLPYQEPLKAAGSSISGAASSLAKDQALRRGLLSLTRWGGNQFYSKASNLGATR